MGVGFQRMHDCVILRSTMARMRHPEVSYHERHGTLPFTKHACCFMLLLLDTLDEWNAKAGPRFDFLCRNLDGSPSPTASIRFAQASIHVAAAPPVVTRCCKRTPRCIAFLRHPSRSHSFRRRPIHVARASRTSSFERRSEAKKDVAMRVVR